MKTPPIEALPAPVVIKVDTKTDVKVGTWKTFKPGIRVKLRPCLSKDYREQTKGQAVEDRLTVPEEMRRYSVMEWVGPIDQDKNPLPCTPEMVDLVCGLVEGFGDWVVNESTAIYKALLLKDEAALKNC